MAGTLLDNCAIRKRLAIFSPRALARGTGEVPEVMDVAVSPGAPLTGRPGLAWPDWLAFHWAGLFSVKTRGAPPVACLENLAFFTRTPNLPLFLLGVFR